MILSDSAKPNQTLYFLGAKLLKCIKEKPYKKLDITPLFDDFCLSLDKSISFTQYIYTLNWLFLLDLIDLDEEGDVIVCF